MSQYLSYQETLLALAEGEQVEEKRDGKWVLAQFPVSELGKYRLKAKIPPKYAPLLKAMAMGRTIQVKSPRPNSDWTDLKNPRFDGREIVYRVKPETLYYRRFVAKLGSDLYVYCANRIGNEASYVVNPGTHYQGFLEWIDDDWIEYEFSPFSSEEFDLGK